MVLFLVQRGPEELWKGQNLFSRCRVAVAEKLSGGKPNTSASGFRGIGAVPLQVVGISQKIQKKSAEDNYYGSGLQHHLSEHEAEPLINRHFCPDKKVVPLFFGQFCLISSYQGTLALLI
jgi:hypothetical protein